MENIITDFIKRRFPDESNWMNGNCYFFAHILASRFVGEIVYDPIEGHFLFLAYDNNLYDWTGCRNYSKEERKRMFLWKDYCEKDSVHYSRIWRDCVK